MLDKDKIKESLTVEEIKKIMKTLGGSEAELDNQGNLMFQTICHGGDSHKLYYYKDSCNFYCYTNCGGIDIYEVIKRVKERQGFSYSFYESVIYVAESTGKSYTTDLSTNHKDSNIINDWEWINKVIHKTPQIDKELDVYNESILEIFYPYMNHWIDEGITSDIAEIYNIGYYEKNNSITIPHYNEYKKLVGIRQRNLNKEDIENGRKYTPVFANGKLYNHQTSHNLYGLYVTKEAIKRHKRIYLFEGEKSCLKAQGFYDNGNFSVAVSGSNISHWQVEKILSLGVNHVVIAFDKFREKNEGETQSRYERQELAYQKKLLRLAHLFTPYCRTYIIYDFEDKLEYSDSPIDQGKEVFEYLTDNKIEITTKGAELLEI